MLMNLISCYNINQLCDAMEHVLQVREEILFKTGKFGGVGNRVEPTEIPEFLGLFEENNQEGIGWD